MKKPCLCLDGDLPSKKYMIGPYISKPFHHFTFAGSEVDLSAPGAQAQLVQTIIIRLRPVVFR